MRTSLSLPAWLLLSGLLASGCQSTDAPVANDLNSTNPAVATQAQKVQMLQTQVEQQKAVIDSEKDKLAAIEQQLKGSLDNLEGLKKEATATP